MVIYAGGWVQVFYSQIILWVLNMRINVWYTTLNFWVFTIRMVEFYAVLSLPSKFHTHINNNFYSIRNTTKYRNKEYLIVPRLAEINLGCSRGIKNVKRLHTDQWLEKFIWAYSSRELWIKLWHNLRSN